MGAYQTAKFGIEGFSEVLRNEVKPLGIKVTIIEPGAFRTDWGGSSLTAIPVSADYDQTVGELNRYRESTVSTWPGDPARAAEIITGLAGLDEPPLRLGARAHEQLGSDRGVGQAVPGQLADLGLPGGEPGGRLGAAPAYPLASGPQLAGGSFGEPVGSHGGEHLACSAQLLTRIDAAVRPAQPFAVQEMGAGLSRWRVPGSSRSLTWVPCIRRPPMRGGWLGEVAGLPVMARGSVICVVPARSVPRSRWRRNDAAGLRPARRAVPARPS